MQSRSASRIPVQSLDMAQEWVRTLYARYLSWRKVSAWFYLITGINVPAGTLCSIASGREPRLAVHRAVLGLPALVPVAACCHCGKVHVSKRCPFIVSGRYRDLYSIPVGALRSMLLNRVEVK